MILNYKIGFENSNFKILALYLNSQNIAISLKPIHFIIESKLILHPRVRISITHTTIKNCIPIFLRRICR